MWKDDRLAPVTEYRAGTYVYNDRALLSRETAIPEQCAMTVLATMVSRPTAGRAIIDAGSKALTSDLLGLDGYGQILEHPEAVIYQLNEEHGLIDVFRCANPPRVGDRVRILPNHTCVVTNLFDRLFVVSGGRLQGRCRSRRAASRSDQGGGGARIWFAGLAGLADGRLRLNLRSGAGRRTGD